MRVGGRGGGKDDSERGDADDAADGEKPRNMRKSACISCSSPSDSTSTHCISVKARTNSAMLYSREHLLLQSKRRSVHVRRSYSHQRVWPPPPAQLEQLAERPPC